MERHTSQIGNMAVSLRKNRETSTRYTHLRMKERDECVHITNGLWRVGQYGSETTVLLKIDGEMGEKIFKCVVCFFGDVALI